ncbi:hypothetical protein RCH09_001019 [Actimicrobium sp. GrIS 1.19]|uniref:hypothetical protein n=1 Tax=Actimicrobium sp. GrIS 1.19 TaxID=3071708 RepID=UPI002E0CEE1D|nr:hypothetical protein [Actimicrobium sp. GrIS 1.19]
MNPVSGGPDLADQRRNLRNPGMSSPPEDAGAKDASQDLETLYLLSIEASPF